MILNITKKIDQKQLLEEVVNDFKKANQIDETKRIQTWSHLKKPNKDMPVFIKNIEDLNEHTKKIEDETKPCFYTNFPEKIAHQAYNSDMNPDAILMGGQATIDAFSIRVRNNKSTKLIRICKAMSDTLVENQMCTNAINAHQQKQIEIEMHKLRTIFTPKCQISHPSEDLENMFDKYPRPPLIRRKKEMKETEKYVGFDVSRAYTACLMQITHIPKFCRNDRLQPMESVKKYKKMINENEFTIDSVTLDFQRDDFIGPARIKDLDDELILSPPDQSHEIIDKHSFYYIIALDTDPYLFENRYNFVTGTTLIYARECNIKFIMIGFIKPVSLLEIDAKQAIKELYENEALDTAHKKNIPNITYGICNKKYQKKDTADIYQKDTYFDTGFMRPFTDDSVLVVKRKKVKLTENYRAVGQIILNNNRIKLHKVATILGDLVKAVKTDCCFVLPKDEEKATKLLKQKGYLKEYKTEFEKIGLLKIEKEAEKTFTSILTAQKKYIQASPPIFLEEKIPITLKDEELTTKNVP